jgi:Ca-activated chloride channel family protein
VTFEWPLALFLILTVPVVLGVYLVAMRRRRKQAVSYSSVALLRSVLPRRSRWRRHLPLATLLASLGMLGVASARPQMVQNVPTARTSIILALDVSRSMCATDVDPNRIVAAQAAALGFVEDLPEGARLGLVVFSGYAQLAVAPTTDRKLLSSAIEALTTGRGTAIGAAMLKSLDAIAEVNGEVAPVGDAAASGLPGGAPAPRAAKPGSAGFVSDIVVLLTDGANTRGIRPLDAVPYAVERRVRIYTIGFGTTRPTALSCTAEQLNGDTQRFGGGGFGGGFGGGGGRSPLLADDETLQQIAEQTGGAAYKAEDAAQLRKVFAELPKDVTIQKRPREVTAPFVFLGALLAAVAMGASIKWSAYP